MKAGTPTQKLAWRKTQALFFAVAEEYRLRWDYTQQRLYTGLGVPPDEHHAADCSSYAALGANWAMHRTGVYLADPLGRDYNGSGNTGSLLAFVGAYPVNPGKYMVGDYALFGASHAATEHVSICRKAGTTATAIFSSNGHQSWVFERDAPEPITLAHEKARQHLLGVYRHPQLR